MPNFRAIKISRKQRQLQNKFGFTLLAELRGLEYAGTITIFRLFTPPKMKYLPKFPYPQKILRSSLSLEIWSTPSGVHSLSLSILRSDRVMDRVTGFTKTSKMFSREEDTRLVLAEQGVVSEIKIKRLS